MTKVKELNSRTQYANDVLADTIEAMDFGNTIDNNYRDQLLKCIDKILFNIMPDKILAIPLPTGAGKSTMMIMACSYLACDYDLYNQSGTIIVRRDHKECNKTADLINNLTGVEVAYSYHSYDEKNRVSKEFLQKHPILVICHEGLLTAIERDYLDRFTTWRNVFGDYLQRERLIIDEEINNTRVMSFSLRDLYSLENAIINLGSTYTFNEGRTFLSGIIEKMIKTWHVKNNKHKLVSANSIDIPEGLYDALKNDRYDDEAKTLTKVSHFIENDGYVRYAREEENKTITTYQHIDINLPQFKNKIVLDATASINIKYRKSHDYELLALEKIKDYSKVKLHVYSPITGSKTSIMKEMDNGLDEALIKYISAKKSSDHKALLVFNNIEIEKMMIANPQFISELSDNIETAHFGNIDGKNTWRECASCFIFGIQILSDCNYPIQAQIDISGDIQGLEQINMYPVKGARRYSERIIEEYRLTRIASDIVQAMNRIVCREYENGYAPAADIYLVNKDPMIEEYIRKAMPGISIEHDWNLNYTPVGYQNKEKNQRIEEQLINLIVKSTQPSGRDYQKLKSAYKQGKGIRKSYIQGLLDIDKKTYQRACNTPLFQAFCKDKNIVLDKSWYVDFGHLFESEKSDDNTKVRQITPINYKEDMSQFKKINQVSFNDYQKGDMGNNCEL